MALHSFYFTVSVDIARPPLMLDITHPVPHTSDDWDLDARNAREEACRRAVEEARGCGDEACFGGYRGCLQRTRRVS